MSLFLTLVFGLSLLHGLKTLRVAQKTKQLPDQNRRWRPKYYVSPTQYIAFIPALGGRHIIPLNTSWLTWQKQSLNFSWVHLLPAVVASVERCHLGTEKGRRAEPSPPSTANCNSSSLWRPSGAPRLHLGLQTREENGEGRGGGQLCVQDSLVKLNCSCSG